jgi:hypothetical protein
VPDARQRHSKEKNMSTPPATRTVSADVRFRELSFEIQEIAQKYINEGSGSADMRNAIRGILALCAGLQQVLQQALVG